MKRVLLLGISLVGLSAQAADSGFYGQNSGWHLMELSEVSVGYKSFFQGGRSPLVTENGLPDRQLGKEINIQLNTNILTYLYWNNLVHGTTEEIRGTNKGQFRLIGYQFELGLRPFNWLDVEYHHHSQHSLDYAYPYGRFPVEDSVGFKIYLWTDRKVNSVF